MAAKCGIGDWDIREWEISTLRVESLSLLIHGDAIECTNQGWKSANESHIDTCVCGRKEASTRIDLKDSIETSDNH